MSNPSHFVAFQIRNQELVKKLKEFRSVVQTRLPTNLHHYLTDSSRAHTTLFVINIPKEKLIEVIEVFKSVTFKLKDDFKDVNLIFKGVKIQHMSKREELLYVQSVQKPEKVQLLEDRLREELLKIEGVKVPKSKLPLHISVANTSIGSKDSKVEGVNLPPCMDYQDFEFGTQRIFSVQLLSRQRGLDSEGYYRCESEVMF